MSLLESFIGVIAPETCIICNVEGSSLCDICADSSVVKLPDRCFRCQRLSPDSKTCSNCRRYAPLSKVWVVSEYEGAIKSAIKRHKFEHKRGLARPLAWLMKGRLPYFKQAPLLTSVATTTSHVRQRGYDHAGRLAKNLALITGYRYVPLLRRSDQLKQVGTKRASRLVQLEQAFRAVRSEYIKDRQILLVDDVVTTGATLTACAKALKESGAKSVSAIVIAQKS